MTQSLKQISLIAATAALLVSTSVFAPAQSTKKAKPVSYKQVQAIFDKSCIGCHAGGHPPAKMNLQNYKGLAKGNDDGPVVVAGKPDKSLLYTVITATGRKQMPPKKPLSKADIALIGAWIKAGAKGS